MSSPRPLEDVAVIVRECGERTAMAAADLLAGLFGTNVHRVSGRPFAVTLRRSFELGIELGRPWTMCVDADVLVLPGALQMLAEARSLPDATFEVQGLVLDKLLSSRRPAGNHLYRTALLPRALRLIPDGDPLRPEMETLLAMAKQGHGYHQSRHLVGLHDFEQWFADIYAKAHLHAQKHRRFESECLSIWHTMSGADRDFEVALRAWRDVDPVAPRSPVSRDVRDRLLNQRPLDVTEKAPLGSLDAAGVVELMRRETATQTLNVAARTRLQAAIDAAVFGAA